MPLNLSEVSPELAAQIVKHFILPMFESDNKRYLRKKYSLHSKGQQRGQSKGAKTKSSLGQDHLTSPKTVYGELKLSEQLNEQLDELKSRFDSL